MDTPGPNKPSIRYLFELHWSIQVQPRKSQAQYCNATFTKVPSCCSRGNNSDRQSDSVHDHSQDALRYASPSWYR